MKRHPREQFISALAVALLFACTPLRAADADGAVEAAKRFRQALQAGDEAGVRKSLAADVLIYESGGQETSREQYMSGHMQGDMAFLGASKLTTLDTRSGGSDDRAWVSTRARITGSHRDKPVDIISTETLVLRKADGAWLVEHVHWSSRPAEKAH